MPDCGNNIRFFPTLKFLIYSAISSFLLILYYDICLIDKKTDMTRVIVVDDHELFRLGVKAVIEGGSPDIVIVGEADTGKEFLRMIEETEADLVLLDILLPDTHGSEIVYRLKKKRSKMKILVISAENSLETVKSMIDLDVEGFISKRFGGTSVLVDAIETIMSGFRYYGRDIAEIIYRIYVAKKKETEAGEEFSDEEKRIIELCREGLTGREIAIRLGVSPRTVDNFKNKIFRKLGINSTLEMVQYALKNGIISGWDY